jgi:hypothetical protein
MGMVVVRRADRHTIFALVSFILDTKSSGGMSTPFCSLKVVNLW